MWDKAKDFLVRAFTVIFLATLVIWFFQTFDYKLNVAAASGGQSLLELVGRLIAPIFAPLGFGDWRASTALIAGFTAKESVVSTLGVLLGVGSGDLTDVLGTMFTPLTAISFLTFVLLYTPCVAAIAAIKREFNSGWAAALVALMQCVVAYAAAFAVYTVGSLITAARAFGAADIVLIAAVAALVVLDIVYIVRKKKQGKCVGCSGDCSACEKKNKADQ